MGSDTCPVCGLDTLSREGGCFTCNYCGYSKCEVSFDPRFSGGKVDDVSGAEGTEKTGNNKGLQNFGFNING